MSLAPRMHSAPWVATHQGRHDPTGVAEEAHAIGLDAILFGFTVAIVLVLVAAIATETRRLYKEGLARHKALLR